MKYPGELLDNLMLEVGLAEPPRCTAHVRGNNGTEMVFALEVADSSVRISSQVEQTANGYGGAGIFAKEGVVVSLSGAPKEQPCEPVRRRRHPDHAWLNPCAERSSGGEWQFRRYGRRDLR